jgi:hypothetical protein
MPDFQALEGHAGVGRFRNLPFGHGFVISEGEEMNREGEMKTRIPVALAVFVLAGFAMNAGPAHAGTNVSVNVGLPVPVAVVPAPVVVAPQPVYVQQPHEMVLIPSSSVYFAPGVSVDLFFYNNNWWNRQGDRWYRGGGYNGPWTAVGTRYVPAPVYRVPANYRTVYVREKPMPYGQWKKMHGEHGGKHAGKHKGNKHYDD